jgi:hypothetical protein
MDLESDRLAATPITEAGLAAQSGSTEPAPIDVVDDGGTLLIVCTTLGRDAASCVVTPEA